MHGMTENYRGPTGKIVYQL